MSSSLEGRVAVVFGVANKRSIAWSIAQGLHEAGAKLIMTYQNERLELEAQDLIASLPGRRRLHVRCLRRCGHRPAVCPTQRALRQAACAGALRRFAPAEELKGDFVDTTREGFRIAHDVSVYSLIALARAAAPLMEDGGSIITMTYYGAEKLCLATT